MRFFGFTVIVGVLFASVVAAGVPPECGDWPTKPAWLWSEQERLDHRFDESCRDARSRAAGDRSRRDGSCRASGTPRDFVFGTDTPELFLPWQLFDTFIYRTYIANPEYQEFHRRYFQDRVREANVTLPEEFWARTERAAWNYLELLRGQRDLAAKLDDASEGERLVLQAEIAKEQKPNCSARHAAFARVRDTFGAVAFDQLLYLATAHGLCSSGDTDRYALVWIGQGCQGQH